MVGEIEEAKKGTNLKEKEESKCTMYMKQKRAHVCIHCCDFNLFLRGARPSSAECFVSNPVLSKLTWSSLLLQEVHRSLLKILRMWRGGGACPWLEMPGKRAWPWKRMVMRGIVGGIMGRWGCRCLRCRAGCSAAARTRPPTFLEPGPSSRAAAGGDVALLPHPGVGICQSCLQSKTALLGDPGRSVRMI